MHKQSEVVNFELKCSFKIVFEREEVGKGNSKKKGRGVKSSDRILSMRNNLVSCRVSVCSAIFRKQKLNCFQLNLILKSKHFTFYQSLPPFQIVDIER